MPTYPDDDIINHPEYWTHIMLGARGEDVTISHALHDFLQEAGALTRDAKLAKHEYETILMPPTLYKEFVAKFGADHQIFGHPVECGEDESC
jgi:hypothetical protein